ncbi:glutamate/gamma-aminobutyrate family transporter YjeM [uncultured Clostridium sp.]|uniref:glutamate/gamma-aminobutyrate family transporter YjeM n=1 Tax=uncultured Clostridium sp. TaxID=59620 RepID=UPI0026184CF3|nr:glutamate/gamma-aminobutyrate family transporter YjeM [uncultured Clostridium sp.]
MSKTKDSKYSLSFFGFLVMIFLTVYGLPNGEQVYYQMGYAAITYLIIAVIIFFVPYSFIVSEMSSAFKDRTGGIFSWMSESVNEGFGLVGTFIWYGSFVVMWFSASSICIAISVAIFGVDTTSTWNLFGLTAPEILAIVGAIYMIIAALITTRGLKRLSFLSNISMVTVVLTHILILGGGLLLFAMSGFKPAQGFDFSNIHSYFYGPNPDYASFLPALGFLVFAVCIFAGMENSGGLVDKVRNGKKNVPRAIFVATVIITVLYIGTVLILGFICNWKATFDSPNVNLANFSIYIVQEEFYRLGTLMGLSGSQALLLGQWINRVITIIGLIGLTSIPLRVYTPIKHMFEGLPKGMFPEKLKKVNKHGMPVYAILLQTIVIVFFVLLLGFGGSNVSALFNKMTLMTFVASTVPISFIVFAYIKFKLNDNIKKEYVFFSKKVGVTFATICFVVVTFTNIYSMIEPALAGNVSNTLWVAGGPVLFGIIAYILYLRYKRKKSKGLLDDDISIIDIE